MKFSGGIESNFGNINVSLQTEGVLNITSKINSNLKSAPSEMWEQNYIDDLLS